MNTPTAIIDCPEARILAESSALRGSGEAARCPGIARPFRLHDWLWATDGRILARIAADLAPSELAAAIGPPEGKIPARFIAECEFKFNALDRERPASLPDDCGPWMLQCPTCNGKGHFDPCRDSGAWVECGDCLGGRLPNYGSVLLAPGYFMAAFLAGRLRSWDAAVYLPPCPPARGLALCGPEDCAYWITPEGVEGLAALMALPREESCR